MKAAYDLHRLGEDERIQLIGAASASQIVGVAVETTAGKADRYVQKVTERFPTVRLISRNPFTDGVELLQFGPLAQQ